MTQQLIFNIDLLTKIWNENNITLLKDYSEQKITIETIIEVSTSLKNYGV